MTHKPRISEAFTSSSRSEKQKTGFWSLFSRSSSGGDASSSVSRRTLKAKQQRRRRGEAATRGKEETRVFYASTGGTARMLAQKLGADVDAMVIDLSSSGVLGPGSIDVLAAEGDTNTLGWTRSGTILTYDIMIVSWDNSWDIQSNHSMTYNFGGTPSSSTNWTSTNIGTPGW